MREKIITEKSLNRFYEKAERILVEHEHEIKQILLKISNKNSIQSEFETSIKALRGAKDEILQNKPRVINSLFIYYPSNMILYSYILYVLIPYVYTRKIYLKPSSRVREVTFEIHNIFKKNLDFDVFYQEMQQKDAVKISTECDITIFTGNYDNAEKLRQFHKENIFIYFGSGINPFIIKDDIDLDLAVQGIIESRLFNSGQDCLCSDIFFISNKVKNEVLSLLVEKLENIKVSCNNNSNSLVTPLNYEDVLNEVNYYINKNKENIFYGGKIEGSLVYPTILVRKVGENEISYEEFFAPIFNIYIYEDITEVIEWINSPHVQEKAMGLSYYNSFLDEEIEKLSDKFMFSHNETLFNKENPNEPFGGYGVHSGYVFYNGDISARPLLLSKEISITRDPNLFKGEIVIC